MFLIFLKKYCLDGTYIHTHEHFQTKLHLVVLSSFKNISELNHKFSGIVNGALHSRKTIESIIAYTKYDLLNHINMQYCSSSET